MACSTGPPTKSWEELPHSLTLPWSSHLLFCFFLSYPPGKFYFHSLVSALKKMPSLKPFQILLHPLSRNLTHLFKDPLHLVCDHPMIILLWWWCYLDVFPFFTFLKAKAVLLSLLHSQDSISSKSTMNTPWINEWMNAWMNTGAILARNIEVISLGI